MPDNRQVQRNGVVSNSSVDNIEVAIRRLKIQTNDKQDSDVVANLCHYPDRPGEPDCIYYLRTGQCGYGSNCRFNHPTSAGQGGQQRGELPERVGQPDCGYYLKTGTCKYGSTCKYHHPRDRHGAGPVPLNVLGLPMRQDEKPCPYYMKTGSCKFGVACKFDHPQPASAGIVLPVPGPTYGSSGSTVVPSSGLHFMGGVSALSVPRAQYLSGSRGQAPQTYMPVVVSPSQGIAPAPGWNTYLTQGDSVSTGLVHMSSASVPFLPERPDQPECRHFMTTGTCRYGSDCKYHHPRERIAQLAPNSLGPLGLPLRPGQAVCQYYSLYGLCKYGPTCKFDHPLAGYSYNYGLSFPSPLSFDPSLYPYQRNSPTLTEASPPKSSKAPDWVRKSGAASNKNQNVDIETPENSSEQDGSPHPMPPSSELPHDQSD